MQLRLSPEVSRAGSSSKERVFCVAVSGSDSLPRNGIKRNSGVGARQTWATGGSHQPSTLHLVPVLLVSAPSVCPSRLGWVTRCSRFLSLASTGWDCRKSRSDFQSGYPFKKRGWLGSQYRKNRCTLLRLRAPFTPVLSLCHYSVIRGPGIIAWLIVRNA